MKKVFSFVKKSPLLNLHKKLVHKALHGDEKYVPIELSEAAARSITYVKGNVKETLLQKVEKIVDQVTAAAAQKTEAAEQK